MSGDILVREPLPVVLGLDRSRDRLGWGAVVLDTGDPLACGVVDLAIKGADGFDGRRPGATRDAVTRVLGALAAYDASPACVFVEAPYAGRSGAVTVDLSLAVGATWQSLAERLPAVPVSFLSPGEWKAAAGVPADPREGRKALKGAALRAAVVQALDDRAELTLADDIAGMPVAGLKPWPMACAMLAGFDPEGSQDAADAALIAVAGRRVNASRWQAAA